MSILNSKLSFILIGFIITTSGCLQASTDSQGNNPDQVVLNSEDLSDEYRLVNQVDRDKSNASQVMRETYERKGVESEFRAVFRKEEEGQTKPSGIISSATVYEDEKRAASDLNSSLNSIKQENNATTSQKDISRYKTYYGSWSNFGESRTKYMVREGNIVYELVLNHNNQVSSKNLESYFRKMVDNLKEN